MGNGTGGRNRRVTSGQRAVVTAWLLTESAMDLSSAMVWADACAVLVDEGWATASRALLGNVLDEVTARRAWSVLVGGMPRGREDVAPRRLPEWAAYGSWSGPGRSGAALFGRDMFDLRSVAGVDRPHVQVLVFGTESAPPVVLVEVSDAGFPTEIEPAEARQFAAALSEAADLVDVAWGAS